MARKLLQWLEFSMHFAFQFLVLVYSLIVLWPANAEVTPAPEPNTSKTEAVKLGAFLGQYPALKDHKLAQSQGIWQLGGNSFSNYRVFRDKAAGLVVQDARQSFLAECKAAGGHVDKRIDPTDVVRQFSLARGISLGASEPLICVDEELKPYGTLFAYSYAYRNANPVVALFVLTPEASADMLVVYHRGMAKELRQQADIIEQQNADEARWASWRAALVIGSETHCGPVLELRGPMVAVAYGTKAGWVRRERLYPPEEVKRCWEFSAL